MYSNVIVRRVRATIGAVEKKNKYYVFWCVCSLRYQARNAHALFLACPAVLYFSTLSHNGTIFEKKKIYWS